MPLEQPRRDNPLMRRYFEEIGLSGKRLAARAGVSHSQMYMARERHVGARNAAKIARAVANLLRLSGEEELELKAEIMGEPGDLLHAYLGNAQETSATLDEPPRVGEDLIGGKPLSYKTGRRVLDKLQAMTAPDAIVSEVSQEVERNGLSVEDLKRLKSHEQANQDRRTLIELFDRGIENAPSHT